MHGAACGQISLVGRIQGNRRRDACRSVQCRSCDDSAGVGFRDRYCRGVRQCSVLRCAGCALARYVVVDVGFGGGDADRVAVAGCCFAQGDDAAAVGVGVATGIDQAAAAQVQVQVGRGAGVDYADLHRTAIGQDRLSCRVQRDCRCDGACAVQLGRANRAVVVGVGRDRYCRRVRRQQIHAIAGAGAGAGDVAVAVGGGNTDLDTVGCRAGQSSAGNVDAIDSDCRHRASVGVSVERQRDAVANRDVIADRARNRDRIGAAAFRAVDHADGVDGNGDRFSNRLLDCRCRALARYVVVDVGFGGGDADRVAVAGRCFAQGDDAAAVGVGVATGIDQAAAAQVQVQVGRRAGIDHADLHRTAIGQDRLSCCIQRDCRCDSRRAIQLRRVDHAVVVRVRRDRHCRRIRR